MVKLRKVGENFWYVLSTNADPLFSSSAKLCMCLKINILVCTFAQMEPFH